MAMALTGIDSVRWWHRNPTSGRNAFCLNAFRNHYPDFIVMTNSGKSCWWKPRATSWKMLNPVRRLNWVCMAECSREPVSLFHGVPEKKDLHLKVLIGLMSF